MAARSRASRAVITAKSSFSRSSSRSYSSAGELVGLWIAEILSRASKKAQFKINATLEDLDYRSSRGLKRAQIEQLRASQWVKEHRNCLITGPTGSGKTYLGCAVGAQACREGYRTLYFYAPKFFRALESARADGSLFQWLKKLARAPLLIIDDLGIASVPGKLYREFQIG